jgi:putative restriction endonuclease
MPWVEMSRDPVHGGGEWGFLKCIWSPTQTRVGGLQGWWENHRRVCAGDRVLHLKGAGSEAAFVGMSTCLADGEITSARPPDPGEWGYAAQFYRTPIGAFESFEKGIRLETVFSNKDIELRNYFEKNRHRPRLEKLSLFYVVQAGRLQCQNGAYLSEADVELSEIILGTPSSDVSRPTSILVGERVTSVLTRIRQDQFSFAVRRNYRNICCFPDCQVAEDRFLVGAHIARWTDVPELRGEVSNGLCLCLMHDRAFEQGFFTVDDYLRVRVLGRSYGSDWAKSELIPLDGEPLKSAAVAPSEDALLHHWLRVGF